MKKGRGMGGWPNRHPTQQNQKIRTDLHEIWKLPHLEKSPIADIPIWAVRGYFRLCADKWAIGESWEEIDDILCCGMGTGTLQEEGEGVKCNSDVG